MTVSQIVATPADEARRLAARRSRYEAQRVVWKDTTLKRVAYCGRVLQDSTGDVVLMAGGESGRAGWSGLQTCGSVWACPVCSEKVNAARQAELQEGMRSWLENGGGIEFGTFTVQHNRSHRLAGLLDAISPAFNRMTSGAGRAWNGSRSKDGELWATLETMGDKAWFGIRGYVRLLEVKHGEKNGWHPHVHVLFFTDAPLTADQREQLRSRLFGRWSKALGKAGLKSLEFDVNGHAVGADLRPVVAADGMADYFNKNTYQRAAYEVTGSHSKQAGKGGRTPFQVLSSLVDASTGEMPADWSPDRYDADRRLWREWEEASKGRRQLTWSRGMRDLLGLDVELTDEEVAEQEVGGSEVIRFSPGEWRGGRLWAKKLLLMEAAERGDLRYLDAVKRMSVGLSPRSVDHPPG